MLKGLFAIVVLMFILVVVLQMTGVLSPSEPSPRVQCIIDAHRTTEIQRLAGYFNSQYEEDTYRRQLEARCRLLYPD